MSKETVFLADSSYAIRKIAERNFAEENNYNLVTFKSGQDLKEQLLEQRPHVVLVELKLPEWNGYEVCSFINSEPSLADTHVFLLRAAFDPVEEEKLQNIKYVDVVTKPFDHTLLIENIEKLSKEAPGPTPPPEADLPEDFPEIDDFDAPSQELSFSDVKEEMEQDNSDFPQPPAAPFTAPRPIETFGDDVQPSEEITQGSVPGGRDRLSPQEPADEIDNPFDDESLSEHIKEQESELGIGSITQEALAIEKAMAEVDEQTDEPVPEEEEIEEPESQTSEVLEESTIKPSEPEDEFKDFTFDDNESFSFPSEPPEDEVDQNKRMDLAEEEEKTDFEIDEQEDRDSFDRPRPPSFLDISASEEEMEEITPEHSEVEQAPEKEDEEPEIPQWAPPAGDSEFPDFTAEAKDEESGEEERLEVPEPIEEAAVAFTEETEKTEPVEEQENRFDDFPGVEDPSDESSYNFAVSPEPDNTRTSESQAIPQIEEPEPLQREVEETEEPPVISTDEFSEKGKISLESMSPTDREIIMQRIEQNISQTLKDILWDIIPPIAERIIREEIESIKKEIAQSIE